MVKGLKPKTSGLNRVSTAMEELVDLPSDWTVRNYKVITFYANSDCTLIWNEEYELPIMAGAGLVLDERFDPCYSLKIKEAGINFYYTVGY